MNGSLTLNMPIYTGYKSENKSAPKASFTKQLSSTTNKRSLIKNSS